MTQTLEQQAAELVQEVQQLRNENARLAEDTAMLDWLEHVGLSTKDGAPNVHSLRDMRTRNWSWTVYGRYFTDLRTAIRAAIGKPEVVAENATTGSEE